jgi:hypothetical protein
MAIKDIIEKARKVGDRHPNGKWVWTEYKPGKFDWRPAKGKKSGAAAGGDGNAPQSTATTQPAAQGNQGGTAKPSAAAKPTPKPKAGGKTDFSNMTPDELVDYANSAKTSSLEAVVNNKSIDSDVRQIAFNVLKKRDDYDKTKVDSSDLQGGHVAKPTPKIQYQDKKPEVEINVPEEWIVRVPGKNGVLENKKATAASLRKLYATKSDDDLLKILNNPNGRWQNRQLAYDEAAARGIPEDKIDVSGKLQKEWDAQKRRHDYEESMKAGFNEEEADAVDVDLKGFPAEEFMQPFLESGDTGWMNKDDPRVRKAFNDFKTLTSRQQYDALRTLYEPTMPGYLNPDNKIGQLNEQYDNFIKYNTTPLFVSAGGAGAGKTYGWEQVADDNNLKPLESDDKVDDQDWGYVMCSDPDDEKDFRSMLAKYNGTYIDDNGEEHPHVLVFDDADKILTSRAGAMKALMKKITDNNPKNRIFMNPETGENEVFKGAILIMTNKDVSAISNASEDAKAILSRGLVNDIQFTRRENMDLIDKRYKTMKLGNYQRAFEKQFPDKKDQQKVRQTVRDWMDENLNDADPGKFTPRTFIQVMSLAGPIIAQGGNAKPKMVGGSVQVGTNVPWQTQALKLIKADTDMDIEKADENEFTEEAMVEAKEKLLRNKKEAKKKDKKRYNALYGKKAIDLYLYGEDGVADDEEYDDDEEEDDNEAKKAFDIDFGMSLDEAENLLLN